MHICNRHRSRALLCFDDVNNSLNEIETNLCCHDTTFRNRFKCEHFQEHLFLNKTKSKTIILNKKN